MAKRGIPILSQVFWGWLATMALLFMGLAGLIGWQNFSGKLKNDDLVQMLFVLRGDKRYAISYAEVEELSKIRAKMEEMEAEDAKRRGGADTRINQAIAARNALEIQKTNYDALKQLLEQEKAELQKIRQENEDIKKKLDEEKMRHVERRVEDAKSDRAKRNEELRKTLVGMDAGDVSQFLEWYMTSREDGVSRAVDYMRSFMKPDFRAEVLTEMSAEGKQKILPRLPNKFAALTPLQVIKQWSDTEGHSFLDKADELMQMPAPQAFGVYFSLDPAVRGKLAPYLRSMNR